MNHPQSLCSSKDIPSGAEVVDLHLCSADGPIPPGAENVARLAKFGGELGKVVPFSDGVLVGVGDGTDPLVLGSAAAQLPDGFYRVVSGQSLVSADHQALGWGLGAYRFGAYRKVGPPPTLVVADDVDLNGVLRDQRASFLVRDLVNTPAEDMGPDRLEDAARRVAEAAGASIEVISGTALEDGFPLINAVGRAAAIAPRLIDLNWGDPSAPRLTLVGKGVTFDSGGLNIKGATGMKLMKKDMGGAANALALAQALMDDGANLSLRVLIPAVENAISGNAFRPGDVFRSRSGQTVEISNTDAEGRLVLADAMSYGGEREGGAGHMITLATLTGAARVALGPDLPPLYSTDAEFSSAVVEASGKAADPVWPMPFWTPYNRYLDSSIADVNHAATTGFAGSITAALFLKRFAPADAPYSHVDLFAWTPSARPGRPAGGEAMAIRALHRVLSSD